MPTLIELLIGAIAIITGLITGARTISQYQLRRKIDTTGSSDLSGGETATVSGPADDCGEQITAPVSGEPALAVGLEVERQSGSRPGWQTTELHARGVPFELRSHGTSVEVDAEGIDFENLKVDDANRTSERLSSDDIPSHFWSDVEQPGTGDSRRYTELRLSTGELTAVGPVKEGTDTELTCPGATYQMAVGEANSVLSDYSPEPLKEQYGGTAALKPVAVTLGAFLIAAVVLL